MPTVLAALLLAPAPALAANAQVGQRFAEANCGHAVGKFGESRLRIAPPFRTLHQRHPVENLAEALAEGIVTGHSSIPEFRLDPDQIANLIGYLKTLEP